MGIKEKNLKRMKNILYLVLWVCLGFHIYRKVNQGIDLWDTGYNLANFQWMGTVHMDKMWLFSTYLSNVIGHFFTLLPGGKTLLGMNIYTTCITALLVVLSACFLARYMKVPRLLIIIGQFVALNVCWAPSAILYDYLTFLFMDIGLILMLIGLRERSIGAVVLCGVLLGANMFVRFSNLTELAFCVLIPAYYVIMWISCRLKGEKWQKVWLREMLHQMAAFLIGYAISVGIILGYISIRYGFTEYVHGIGELMEMSKTTPGYSPQFMITHLTTNLIRYGLRLWHVILAAAAGAVCGILADRGDRKLRKHIFIWIAGGVGILLAIRVIYTYLNRCDYISKDPMSYDSVYAPMLMIGVMTIVIAVARVFSKTADMAEKFLGVIVVSAYLLSVVGSSTEFLLGMNNYFVLMPYFLWEIYNFCKAKNRVGSILPGKIVVGAFVVFCCYMTIGYGRYFVYEEAGTWTGRDYEVTNNETLRGIHMTSHKASMIQEMTTYLDDNELNGREVILYDMNPSLAFYLQLPPAFNSWPALGSYSCEKLEKALDEVKTRETLPIMILFSGFETDDRPKADVFREYMSECGYEKTYSSGMYDIYVAGR